MRCFVLLFAVCLLVSCQENEDNVTPEERQKITEIIEKTIVNSGGENYKRATIVFKFRDHIYKSRRGRGEFYFEKKSLGSADTIRDVVSNTGFKRFINDSLVEVPDSMVVQYSTDVNTVHYFAHLPYGLDDPALKKDLVGDAMINGEPYFQLKMTYQHDVGGANHDEFMFWIHKEDFTLDYLAYKFSEEEGGIRFRAAFDPVVINGIRFTDYKNYTIDNFKTDLKDLDELYQAGKLKMISTIETEVLKVEVEN